MSAAPSSRYHVPVPMLDLFSKSDEELERWAADPNCIERAEVADYLAKRRGLQDEEARQRRAQIATKINEMKENPFDPRTEVSADAKYIASRVVKHLWILLFALPLISAILYILSRL